MSRGPKRRVDWLQEAISFWLLEGLPPRIAKTLARAGLGLWSALEGWSDEELLELHGIGPRSLAMIREAQPGRPRPVEPPCDTDSPPEEVAEEILEEMLAAERELRSLLGCLYGDPPNVSRGLWPRRKS